MNRAVLITLLTTTLGIIAGALVLLWLINAYSSPFVWLLGVISAISLIVTSFFLGVWMGATYFKRQLKKIIGQ